MAFGDHYDVCLGWKYGKIVHFWKINVVNVDGCRWLRISFDIGNVGRGLQRLVSNQLSR